MYISYAKKNKKYKIVYFVLDALHFNNGPAM